MMRFLFALGWLGAIAAALSAAPTPADSNATKDREGNPLPKGATTRLGSLSLRVWPHSHLSFSEDGKQLRSSLGWNVFPFDAQTGRPLAVQSYKALGKEEKDVAGFVIGDRLFTVEWELDKARKFADDNTPATITAWNREGKEISRFATKGSFHIGDSLAPSSAPSAAVSCDGRTFALVVRANKRVEVYDTDTGKQLYTQPVAPYHGGCAISPDGKTLYICDLEKPIRRFELISGKALPNLDEADQHVDYFAVSSDGKRVVTRGTLWKKDENGKEKFVKDDDFLRVHDTETNKVVGKLEAGVYPAHFAFAGSDGVLVIVAKYRSPLSPEVTLERWSAKTLKREWSTPLPPLRVIEQLLVVSPDGKKVAVTDRNWFAYLFNAETGKPIVETECHSRPVSWVGFKANGESVVTAAEDSIRTWAIKGGPKGAAKFPELTRGRVAPELFGEHLVWVSHSDDGKKAELVGWDREKGEIGWRLPLDGPAPDRILSNDGKRCATVSWDRKQLAWGVAVYDGPVGKKLHDWQLKPANPNAPFRLPPLALSPNGEVLFVAGDGAGAEKGISLLDVATGNKRNRIDAGPFRAADAPGAFPISVSADGTKVAVIQRSEEARESSLRVFDSKTGKSLAEHPLGSTYLPAVRFSPSGKQVAVWNKWSTAVTICDAESSQTEPRKLDTDAARPTCAAFSPNGASLAVGYEDGTSLIWDLSAK